MRRITRLGGMPFLFWRLIQDARARGFAELDLGRSDVDQPGLIAFKDHLGATRSTLTYYRYPKGQRDVVAQWLDVADGQAGVRAPAGCGAGPGRKVDLQAPWLVSRRAGIRPGPLTWHDRRRCKGGAPRGRRGIFRTVQDAVGIGRSRPQVPSLAEHRRCGRGVRRGPAPGIRDGATPDRRSRSRFGSDRTTVPCSSNGRVVTFPLYTGAARVRRQPGHRHPEGTQVETSTTGINRKAARHGGLATTCFPRCSYLLTRGQPSAFALTPTLELHIALLRRLLLQSGVSFVEIPPRPGQYEFVCCLTHDVDFFGIRRHKWDRTLAGLRISRNHRDAARPDSGTSNH